MNKKGMDRRGFLKLGIISIGGLIGAALSIPAIAFIIGPALQGSSNKDWIPLGSTSKIENGKPALFKATLTAQAGWITNQQELNVYVLTEDGRDYTAMSNVCTHLGCHIRWIEEKGEFFCPCHNGVFDKQGNVVSGPPPKPLDRYTVKVENEQIFIQGA